MLQVTRPMYNNVWQRGDGLNAPIKKIIFRTNYVENKIKNKLSILKNKKANNFFFDDFVPFVIASHSVGYHLA